MTSLTLVRRIAARPSVVFDLMTTAEGIARWWGPDDGPVLIAESDPRVGGRYRVRFRMLDGSEHESRGEFLEVRPPERVAMTWRWQGDEDEGGDSRVEIDLRAIDGGGTELTFTHSRLASEATRESHEGGWGGALDKLERYVLRASAAVRTQ
ncbi:MAG: SRPBCC family protein [Phenylobacterium sp.]